MDYQKKFLKRFPYFVTIFGAIGFVMAFLLTLEKVKTLMDSNYIPNCDLNPLISCGSVMSTPQASVFGFPNPLIGIFGFAIVVTIGMALFAGAKFKRWYWIGFYLGILFAISFVHWLMYQSIYVIGALCPNCMVVWTITAPLFYYTLLHAFSTGNISLGSKTKSVAQVMWNYQYFFLFLWYLAAITLILRQFWYFFGPAIFN